MRTTLGADSCAPLHAKKSAPRRATKSAAVAETSARGPIEGGHLLPRSFSVSARTANAPHAPPSENGEKGGKGDIPRRGASPIPHFGRSCAAKSRAESENRR